MIGGRVAMVRGVETVWSWMRMVLLQNFTTADDTKTRIYFRSPEHNVLMIGLCRWAEVPNLGRHRSEHRTVRSDGIMGQLPDRSPLLSRITLRLAYMRQAQIRNGAQNVMFHGASSCLLRVPLRDCVTDDVVAPPERVRSIGVEPIIPCESHIHHHFSKRPV
jgi:hypothetical protein